MSESSKKVPAGPRSMWVLLLLSAIPGALAGQAAGGAPHGMSGWFRGEVGGEVPRFTFDGELGGVAMPQRMDASVEGSVRFPTTLLSGLADLGPILGVCFAAIGFWDDEHKAHLNFILTLPAGEGIETFTSYTVGWERDRNRIPAGQLLVTAMFIWRYNSGGPAEGDFEAYYADYKAQAANPSPVMGPDFFQTWWRDLTAAFATESAEAPEPPGRNYYLTAENGAITITEAADGVIGGRLTAYMGGGWDENIRSEMQSGRVTYVQIEGAFEVRNDRLARCVLGEGDGGAR